MITNTSMTLYHRHLNSTTKIDEWTRYNIIYVMWQGGKGSSLNKGYENANDVTVRIPYNTNTDLSINNFKIGDIIVKGTLNIDITTQRELSNYETYNITSINDNNYYSNTDGNHIHIGAK